MKGEFRILSRVPFFHEHLQLTGLVNFSLWFILGTLNNFGYSIILSAARSIAVHFDAENLIGFIPWANVGIGMLVRPANILLERVPFAARFAINAFLLLVGPLSLAVSIWIDLSFYLSIACILVVGASSSFGETVLLTYMKLFDSKSISGWSSGTGMAGVGAALSYLIATALDIPDTVSFLIVSLLAAFYILAFTLLIRPTEEELAVMKERDAKKQRDAERKERRRRRAKRGKKLPSTPSDSTADVEAPLDITGYAADETQLITPDNYDDYEEEDELGDDDVMIEEEDATAAVVPVKDSFPTRFAKATGHVLSPATQLALVYFFEYVASTGCAAKAQPVHDASAKTKYVVLQLSYQIGVFISRSSLSVVRIRAVWILTALQFVNFILWQIQAEWKLVPFLLQIPAMVFVGLLGGAMYVNVLFNILSDKKIPDDLRELGINITTMFVTLGITASSVYDLAIDKTFLANK